MTLREKINKYAGKLPYAGNFLTYEINPKINAMGIVTLGLVTYLTFSAVNEVKAAKGSAELTVGNKSTTLETNLSGNLAPNAGFFAKNRATVDYKNKHNSFSLVDLSHSIYGGFYVATEVQFPQSSGAVPRLGFQYLGKFGDTGIFILSTAGIRNPDVELITNLQYNPKLSKDISLVAKIETATNVDKSGHNFSSERFRLGLGVDDYKFGFAGDFSQKGNNVHTSYNIGGFLKKDF